MGSFEAFDFGTVFAKIKSMDANWHICIQVLESRIFKALYEKD